MLAGKIRESLTYIYTILVSITTKSSFPSPTHPPEKEKKEYKSKSSLLIGKPPYEELGDRGGRLCWSLYACKRLLLGRLQKLGLQKVH